MTLNAEVPAQGLGARFLARARTSRLVRQNLVLFAGGMLAGVGGFVYHLVAARLLGPALYGEVASLVSAYLVGNGITFVITLVLARYAATLEAGGSSSALHHLMVRTSKLMIFPSLLALALLGVLAPLGADFLHLHSWVPVLWMLVAMVMIWQVGVPRGMLQGMQRFAALSVNQSVEMVVRVSLLILLLLVGFGVTGAMLAVLAGAAVGYASGMYTLRDILSAPGERVRLRTMASFAITAAVGTLGILFLYNNDVILAKHYLNAHDAGIYGGLNKIETIIYFGTLSVSQVLYPRVVEAIAKDDHPGRLVFLSAGIVLGMGAVAVGIFALAPTLIVKILYGDKFLVAAQYMVPIGLIGLALSLNNLLVYFFMAAHDRVFMPILLAGVILEGVLIFLFHTGLSQVIADVLSALVLLLGALVVRGMFLLPALRPEMVAEEVPV